MAGASLASTLAAQPGLSVTLLEREAQCGVHATGRSAALYLPSYGPPGIRALTQGSGAFYTSPPTGFAEHPLLTPRGALHVAWASDNISPTAATNRLDALEQDVACV